MLRARLITLPITTEVQYDAISYKWASWRHRAAIECDGSRIVVTKDVENMLRRLRRPAAFRRLWIDSICINQDDETEKSQQIARMTDIYRNAFSTFIWLGEEDKTTSSAFSLLNTLKEVNLLCEARFEPGYTGSKSLTFDQLRKFGLPEENDPRWLPLISLLYQPWFTRTWVLQEVTLATSPWMQCGSYCFSWNDKARILTDLKNGNVDGHYDISLDLALQIGKFGVTYQSSSGATLLQLLCLAHATRAKESNDQIFAILGLASDRDSIRPLVNYSASANENYKAIALHYLSAGCLEILNFANDPSLRELQRLPSWVPDWHTDAQSIGLLSYLKEDVLYDWIPTRRELMSYPQLRHQPQRLCIQGVVDDQVCAVGLHFASTRTKSVLQLRMRSNLWVLEQWRYLASKLKTYAKGESIIEAFAKTIVCGRNVCGDDKSMAGLYACHAKDIEFHVRAYEGDESYSRDELELYRNFFDFCTCKRTFYVTRRGYVGLGPYFLRPGDLVAHFEGGLTPFIIRKVGSTLYRLVGDTYIHGLMDHEVEHDKCVTIELV